MRDRNYTKIFAMVGIVLAEVYMLYAVLAPMRTPEKPTVNYLAKKIVVSSIFFGAFGGLVGTGVGLLVTGALRRR
jgi:hypothetical protein